MSKLILPVLVGLTALLLVMVGCSSGSGETPVSGTPVSLGQQFTLQVGQTAVVKGEDLSLTFLSVEDSRCARGNQCIWAGEAKSLFRIVSRGITNDLVFNQPGGSDGGENDITGTYHASFQLAPYPDAGTPLAQGDYRITIIITKQE